MSHKIAYERWTFPPDKIEAGDLHLASSLLSSSLEVNSLLVRVVCGDPAILDFQRNAKLLYYAQPDRPMIFRVQSIKRVGPELYEISATSTLGLLTEGQHMGGIYTGQTAKAAIASICGTIPFAIKHDLEDIKLYGWLPIAAPRDNLAQVLFAIGAALKTDLDGVLRIESLWDGISGTADRDRMYQEAAVDYAARITQAIVIEHQYVPWTEEEQLFEGTAQAGDIITFSEPMHSLSASGFSIQASGANWARVSAGSGVLKGRKYLHNTRQVVRDVQSAQEPNIKSVEDATLVSLVNSQAVAQRLADYYKCRETVDAPVVYRGEQPGDRLATYHPFDKTGVDACLESVDITLSNTLKAQERSLVGFVPRQIEQLVTYDQRELLTGSGTWTVPEGVSSIRAVLIGGGQSGAAGAAGGNVILTSKSYTSGSFSTPSANGASGGKGGAGGTGGKVLETTISVTAGQKIAFSVGPAAQNTTFGTLSSANGGTMPIGWTDPITGDVFAKPGEKGMDGGKGGNGGARGESVGSHRGGVPYTELLNTGKEYVTASWAGSGGGGASATADGQYGMTYQVHFSGYVGSNTITSGNVSVSPRSGGDGAAGGKGDDATVPGCGGNGGHGGGGAGGVSTVSVSLKMQTSGKVTGSYSGTWMDGGAGGSGGSGAPGCIILYYGVVRKVPAGQLVDRNNRMILDRLGRRIIV